MLCIGDVRIYYQRSRSQFRSTLSTRDKLQSNWSCSNSRTGSRRHTGTQPHCHTERSRKWLHRWECCGEKDTWPLKMRCNLDLRMLILLSVYESSHQAARWGSRSLCRRRAGVSRCFRLGSDAQQHTWWLRELSSSWRQHDTGEGASHTYSLKKKEESN